MAKVPKIETIEDKERLIAYLLTNCTPRGLNAREKYRFKEKAKHFSYENGNLFYSIGTKKYTYICNFDILAIKNLCDMHHLPSHNGRNMMREDINKNYVGISVKSIYEYVNTCTFCQREAVPAPRLPLIPIVPSFIKERLIVDTIDLSEYAEANNGKKYIFTMIYSFSKFAWCYPSERKSGACFLEAFKHFFRREGSWKIFHSDNGGEFVANEVQTFIRTVMRAQIVHGAPYRPQTQGQI